MVVREVGPEQKEEWDKLISSREFGHVLQSWDWGEFKKTMGTPPIRLGVFDHDKLVAAASYTKHPIPYTKKFIGYLPKGPTLSTLSALSPLLEGLKSSAIKNDCVFLKIEPNVPLHLSDITEWKKVFAEFGITKSLKDVFAKHTLYLDLTKTEEELLSAMHEKWRYNIRLAEKKGVVTEIRFDNESSEEFIYLQKLTAKRNRFYIHQDQYYRNLWLTLEPKGLAHLMAAKLDGRTLALWMLFHYGRTLYYPYGASGSENREFMPSHALMWQSIKFGKDSGCRRFDLWGASDPNSQNDPWQGFTRFKAGFGPELITFMGAYDMVLEPKWYKVLSTVDKARWWWLKLRSRF